MNNQSAKIIYFLVGGLIILGITLVLIFPNQKYKNEVMTISIEENSIELIKGENYLIKYTIQPENTKVKFSSNDQNIAIIDENGNIQALNEGTTDVVISLPNGTVASCTVTVTVEKDLDVLIEKISLDRNKVEMNAGKSITLKATSTPSSASDKGLTWTSSDSKVATVKNGTVNAKKAGKTTITVKTSNGKTAACEITVIEGKTSENIHFINVVGGDATLIESNGRYGLIDAANTSIWDDEWFNVKNGSGTTVLNYLKSIGVNHLDFIIASHAHSDHIGGIPELVNNSNLVDNTTVFIYKQVERDSTKYGVIVASRTEPWVVVEGEPDWKSFEFLAQAKQAMSNKGAIILETSEHSSSKLKSLNAKFTKNSLDKRLDYIEFKWEDLKFDIYNLYQYTEKSGGKTYIDINTNSFATLITTNKNKKILMAGDLNVKGGFEKLYADKIGKVDVLKASHHGNFNSNSKYFLSKTHPAYFIIPRGINLNISTGGLAAYQYVTEYGGKVWYSGIAGNSAVVVKLDSNITVNKNPDVLPLKDKWLEWNDSDLTIVWVYVGSNGRFVKNDWAKEDNKWYYLDGNGYMLTSQWLKYENKWYYLEKSGSMAANKWIKDGNDWYYLESSGAMAENRWLKYENKWYYLGADGKMYANTTKIIDGKSYHFDKDGICDSD